MVAIKLDVEKAYDTISWEFLQACLIQLGFHSDFVEKLMVCITSVRYKVRINNRHTASFTPSRGLRQGDPLSPYLYIIYAEALSRYINHLSTTNKMLLPKIAPLGRRVGLLQFADDLLFFLQLNTRTLVHVGKIIQLFEEEAGQCINKTKSQLMFSRNTSPALIRLNRDTLQISRAVTSFDYLGTPLAMDRC